MKPSQLCVGLYVHLDLPWVEHPFTFSSFKIKGLDQVVTLQSLGLTRIRYSPAKSDCEPLIVPAHPAPMPAPPVPRETDPAYQAKRERLELLAQQRAKIADCEREFLSTTRSMKSIRQNLFSLPDEVCDQATTLVDGIADSMLVDVDISIHLMSNKVGGDDLYNHALNVTLLSMIVAKEMKVPPAAIKLLGLGALFHDVGYEEVPDRIKNKLGTLTKADAVAMQQHVSFGVDIGKRLGLPVEALVVIAQHHERIDGSGYPMKLLAPQLSVLSRIVALVNTFDELCNPLDLSKAITPHEALSIIYVQQRSQFDALAITTFVRCLGVYPPGTIVMLSNGALGMVASVNSSRPLKPTVLVYDPDVSKKDAILVDLEREPDVTISRTIKPLDLTAEAYNFLAPRKRMSYYFSASTRARLNKVYDNRG